MTHQKPHRKPHQCAQTNHHYQANADGFGDPTLGRFSWNSDSSIAACRWSHVVADYENLRPIPVCYRLVAASARKSPQMMHHPVFYTQHTDYGGPGRQHTTGTVVFSNFCTQHETFCPFKVCDGAGACTKLWHRVALPTHNPPLNLMPRTGVQIKLNKIIKYLIA